MAIDDLDARACRTPCWPNRFDDGLNAGLIKLLADLVDVVYLFFDRDR